MNHSSLIRILLVEDEPSDARLLSEYLSPLQFVVTTVARLNQALKHLDVEHFDAILLDLSLPDSTGLETVQHVLTSFPTIPIIVLTGLDDEESAVAAVRYGAQDYLVKNRIDSNLLTRALRYAIQRKSKDTQLENILREKENLLAELTLAHTELEKAHAVLHDLAIRDGLTGLYNRREMELLLAEEILRSHRYQRPFTLLILDLDHFKNVNDTFGHPVGDQVLRGLGKFLIENVRAMDRPARYGGEEFVVLLPELDGSQAAILTERLRKMIADNPFPVRLNDGTRHDIRLTISCGFAEFPTDADSAVTLVAAADRALYQAKAQGRNCAVRGSRSL